MTEQTWNQSEIEAAATKVGADDTIDSVISALTKPKPVFKEGEVVARKTAQGDTVYFTHEGSSMKSHRHLNETEVPALALAMERLEELASEKSCWDICRNFAQTALNDIKESL